MTTQIQTVETRVLKGDDEGTSRTRALAYRNEDLNNYGRVGFTLTHTAVIQGTEYDTFVDTLTRTYND